MKLLAEDYLGGRVSFSSTAEGGTTFTLSLPLSGPQGGSRWNAKGAKRREP